MVRSRNFNNPNMGDPRCPEKKGFGGDQRFFHYSSAIIHGSFIIDQGLPMTHGIFPNNLLLDMVDPLVEFGVHAQFLDTPK
jgi:hypothetical protein